MIADVMPGGSLGGPFLCAAGTLTYVTEADGTRRLSAVSAVTGVNFNSSIAIDYLALDRFRTDINGFGGPTLEPADKRTPLAGVRYDYFRKASELEIYRTGKDILFATMGRLSGDWVPDAICFYAAGPPAKNLPTSNGWWFYGLADGLALRGGKTERLFGSDMRADYDAAKRELSIRIMLRGRDQPFGDFASRPATDITVATARVTLNSGGGGSATLTGADGSTGTISGRLFGNLGIGLGFVFELNYPNGDRIFGAIAGDMNLI